MHPGVEARGLGVGLDGQVLLAPTSFDLEPGRALAVTGPNGAGKTTLLRVLAGLSRPTTGTATIAGRSACDRSPEFRRTVAAHLGPPPFARDLTLREHAVLVAASWGIDLPDAEERVDAVFAELGIGHLTARFPHELSSGQRQLFALVLTLVRPFAVLLADEPEQRLDEQHRGLVAAALRRRRDRGTTIVLVSHSPVLVDAVADDIVALAAPPS